VAINGEKFTASLVFSASGERFNWECAHFDDLRVSHFERLAEMDADLVIFGSGERLRFPKPELLQALYTRKIGVETMDTHAACRTYNFLASEGRKVVAALLL
jgi:uncharacterized protein